MKSQFSMFSMKSVRRSLIVVFLVGIISASLVESSAQQFFPNGRYGRRDSMPQLSDTASGREMTVAFFGDGSVRCVYTGFQDYYKCARKMESRPIPSPMDD